jgi:hypothetical protein
MKQLEHGTSPLEMDKHTGIDPVHAANVTLHELRIFFRTELPADFEARLVRRMELAFARHARWRDRATHSADPDFVRIFFRRWLAELLFKERRDLFWRLPPGYRHGEPRWPGLHPPKSPKAKAAPVKALPEPPKVAPADITRPVRKPVRLSLPCVHGAELLAA